MNFQDKKRCCIILILILFILILLPFGITRKQQPEGDYIKTEEVKVLTELLQKIYPVQETAEGMTEEGGKSQDTIYFPDQAYAVASSWEEGDMTYRQFKEWEAAMGAGDELWEEYKSSFFVRRKDWYAYFDRLCLILDPQGKIKEEQLFILGDKNSVKNDLGEAIENDQLFSHSGIWNRRLPQNEELFLKTGTYISYDGSLWGVKDFSDKAVLKNAWLLEAGEELLFFYENHEVRIPAKEHSVIEREQIVDLTFMSGKLEQIEVKKDRISGEVLKLTDTELEIKGQGSFPLDDSAQFYQIYDRLGTVGHEAIRLGYDFTDFVLQDGKVQAGLLVKDETMEYIRVLLKTSNFNGYYHEQVEFFSDVEMKLSYGKDTVMIPAGETISIDTSHPGFQTGRIFLEPTVLTGRTFFPGIERNHGGQGYRGSFELEQREEGILIINQLLLEEYLYAVVPSEMPSSYPIEALKAQAICARTYAYDKMEEASLAHYGAHLDDSSTFQVYNNIQENTNTTKAVKETRGLLLYHQNQLAETYYYSTSSGFGTDDGIWNQQGISQFPYLKAKEMTQEEGELTAEDLMKEEVFQSYIDQPMEHHFEAKEAWYRWHYEYGDLEGILGRLRSRQKQYPKDILVSKKETGFQVMDIPQGLILHDIQVNKRGAGGRVEELIFDCGEVDILVKKELQIRGVLTDGNSQVVLQDGKKYACENLLPSSFFYLVTEGEEGGISRLIIKGGGFGHGVGMSQNGAKNLAKNKKSCEEILLFYYTDCVVRKA